MLRVPKVLAPVLVLAVGLMLTPSMAAADGLCGTVCVACEGAPSPDYKTGDGTLGHSQYKLFCTQGACASCEGGQTFATRRGERRDAVASQLRASRPSEFSRLATQHRSTLRLDSARRLLVVLGGCDGRSVVSIASLNAEQLAVLERVGIASLASHFEFVRSRSVAVVASAR